MTKLPEHLPRRPGLTPEGKAAAIAAAHKGPATVIVNADDLALVLDQLDDLLDKAGELGADESVYAFRRLRAAPNERKAP